MPQPITQATLAALYDRIYRAFRFALHEHHDAERVIVGVTRAQNWWAVASVGALILDRDRRGDWGARKCRPGEILIMR